MVYFNETDCQDEILTAMLNRTFSVFCGSGATYDATQSAWIDIFSDETQNYYKKIIHKICIFSLI